MTKSEMEKYFDNLERTYQKNANKVTAWSETPSDNKYASEKLVKDTLDTKADSNSVPTKTSDLINDSGFLTSHQDISGKANSSDLADVATSGDYTDLTNTPVISIEQQQTAEAGYFTTYGLTIDGTQTGAKINIPKDFLVKSASIGTVSTADTPVQGYAVGDKYFDFVINTKDNSGTDEHLYLLVTDFVDTYVGDNTTIEVINHTISVKAGSIGATQLDTATNTKLGYADDWNNSPAKTITAQNITDWSNKSNLTQSDVDTSIENAFAELNGLFE